MLIEKNGMGRHPHEPKSVLCRRHEVMLWTGWKKLFIDKLVQSGVLKVNTPAPHCRRMFYTAQIKELLEKES
jgi:hypothetical protein